MGRPRALSKEEEREALNLYEKYENARQVANFFECSDQTIYRILKKYGIPRTHRHEKARKREPFPSNCKTKYCPAVIVMLYVVGNYTSSDISRLTNIPIASVCNTLRRRCGDAFVSRQDVLRNAEVDSIASEYVNGATTYELGKKYCVHHSTISKLMCKRGIRRGKGNSTGHVATCQRCGKRFTAHRSNQKYCSMTCQRAVTGMRHDDLLRCANHGYAIPLLEVYKRDKGRCYICGKKTDWKDFRMVNGCKVIGNLYPTRDHVIALHNGGTHTWDNVRLACHRCNSAKSDKGQMRIAI